MKLILQTVTLAVFFFGTQAAVGGSFPASGDPIELAPLSTYADGREIAPGGSAMPFAASGDPVELQVRSTHADRRAGEIAAAKSYPDAGNGDPVVLDSLSSYAEDFGRQRSTQAAGATDPALSR